MKRLLSLILLLFIFITCTSQLFVIVEPLNFQPGLTYVNNNIHGYVGVRIGHTNMEKAYTNYIKLRIGTSIIIDEDTNILVGINYNKLYNQYNNNPTIDFTNIKPISFEIGLTGKIYKRLNVIFLTDFLNWETDVGISYCLTK